MPGSPEADRADCGTNSRNSPSRFAARRSRRMPVMFPPGRLKLATSPAFTGSPPLTKTIGMVDVAAFAASARQCRHLRRSRRRRAHKIGRKGRQPIIVADGMSVFDVHVLAFHVAGFSLAGGGSRPEDGNCPADSALRKPTTGIAACCACAASGHAAAAPPSSVMNSRRFIRSPRRQWR